MRKRIVVSVIVIALLVACLGYEFYISKFTLSIFHYTLTSIKIEESMRLIQLTDLHNSEFGSGNEKLISKVIEQEPDLILITGDLVNSDEENTDIAVNVIDQLSQIAPVYFSYGNHEKEYETRYGIDMTSLFERAGARVLEYSYEDIRINGQWLRIGGIYGYCTPEKYLETNEADPEECAFLKEFQNTDYYSILLCHMPFSWIHNDAVNEWNIDCVFSGHVHGGEVILPFAGGLYAPDFGLFPGKLQGLYYSDDGENALVLSRGLGTAEVIPRFNNVPEIVVVDLLPNKII